MRDLVLLPGLSFDSRVFQSLREWCEPECTVHAIDYDSISHQDLTLDAWFDCFAQQLPDQAHYVGWSVGGLFAWKLAEKEPERVLSVASFCSSPRFLQTTNWPGVTAENWTPFTGQAEESQRAMQRQLLRLQADRHALRELGKMQLQYPFGSWQLGLAALEQWDMRQWLVETKIPLLIALAEQDKLILEKPLKKALDDLHVAVRSLPGCGHACIYTDAERCFFFLKEFWRDL
jgi:pimeloyl-[acyl-carrier protein] methyl ester esterase